MDMNSQLARALGPMMGRIRMMVARAVIAAVNDASKMQRAKVSLLADETKDGAERFQNYGFTSHPHAGAEAIMLSVSGGRDHGVIIVADDRRYRLASLQAGEVAIYTDEGDSIVLKRGRNIEVNTLTLTVNAETKARFVTPLLECTGEVKDRCDADGMTMEEMRETYNAHTHGGIEPGPSNTSTPSETM